MMQGDTVEDILDFAIEREQEAADFYTDLVAQAKAPAMKDVFRQFSLEEQSHKDRLNKIKEGKQIKPIRGRQVLDLKIADYVVAEEPGPDINYQSALILAMKKEKAAFRLYTALASQVEDPELKKLLFELAQEEAKHKLRFEVEYDEYILKEN
ncbi:MAG: ferritin family protein [Candidatus Eisenbacteria sp.]|nr:ferritin family protein [Candidatus Eisenbacteria bacterium]